MRSCLSSAAPALARVAFIVAALLGLSAAPRHAAAQEIVVSVNGDPITSVDIEQRMKLLRAIHKPATRDAAIESMVADRLKAHEGAKFGVVIKDDEIGEQVQIDAKKMKIQPQALVAAITNAGVSQEHMRNHFKAELAYLVLTKALNKGVEASEIAVRQELAKEKGKSGITTYTIRQVVFTLEPGAGAPALEAAAKQAAALRAKFSSCETGIPYAKSLPGVAVREPLTRSSTQLGEGIKDVLDKTPIGHLTAPSRSPNGIEVIAVCERGAARNDDELRKEISDRILADHIEQDMAQKYREMRATAVIAHPHG
jgi:peptidyl-prolyl cis-trans isomerase SurA